MTEVNSQIQFPAALPRAESVKYFEGTVQDMNSSLRIPLRIHAVCVWEREREANVQTAVCSHTTLKLRPHKF